MSRDRTLLTQALHTRSGTNNTAETVTLTGVSGKTWLLRSVAFSYDGTPTAGRLTITTSGGSDDGVVFGLGVAAAGPGNHAWPTWRSLGDGVTAAITLAAGGAVKGEVNVEAKLVDANLPSSEGL
jgi:hypothetical protein